jgi:peptidoglycan/LPS O-acetylase OafA/YrhL
MHRHKTKAILGIIVGVLLVIAGAVGAYYTYQPGEGTSWVLLMLPGMPLAAWGCAHLARHRGYSTTAGYALFVFGFGLMSFVPGTHTPVTVGFGFIFAALVPVVVLFALPDKSHHSHSSHRSRRR